MKNYIKILIIISFLILIAITSQAQDKIPEIDFKINKKEIKSQSENTILLVLKANIPEKHHAFLKSNESGIPLEIGQPFKEDSDEVIEQGIEIENIKKPEGIKEDNDIILKDENIFEIKIKIKDKSKLKNKNTFLLRIYYQMCDEKSGICYRPKTKIISYSIDESINNIEDEEIEENIEDILNENNEESEDANQDNENNIKKADITINPTKIDIKENEKSELEIIMNIPEKHHAFLDSKENGVPVTINQPKNDDGKNIDQGIEIIEIVKPKGIKEEDDILLRDENKFQIKFKLNDSKKLKDGYILILNFRYQMCDEKTGICYMPQTVELKVGINKELEKEIIDKKNDDNINNNDKKSDEIKKKIIFGDKSETNNTPKEQLEGPKDKVEVFKNAVYGWILMFGFSIGFGILFIVLGTFSSLIQKLPKSGNWMKRIQFFFGFLMGIVTFYFTYIFMQIMFLDKYAYIIGGIGIGFILLGIIFGAFKRLGNYLEMKILLRKVITLGIILIGLGFVYYSVNSLWLSPKLDYQHIKKVEQLDKLLIQAKKEEKMVFLDFGAPWCVYCKKFDSEVLVKSDIRTKLESFIVAKVNFDESPELANLFSIKGLPYFIFIDNDRYIAYKHNESWDAESFNDKIDELLGKSKAKIEPSITDRIKKNLNDYWKTPLIAFLICLLGGFISVFTPCVYPLIPLTISYIGSRSSGGLAKGFVNSLFYVLGIAIVYSTLGVIAALLGTAFGSVGNNPIVLVLLIMLFGYFTFAMFGYYEIKLPSSFQRAKQEAIKKKNSYLGMIGFGMAAGLVASPCLTPIIGALLGLIAKGVTLH